MTTSAVKYDTRALAVGQAVLRETGAEDVILFGSRARGDYREDSDIDLLLIHSGLQDHALRGKVKDIAKATAADLYGSPVGVDLIWFSPEGFDRMRRSHNDASAIASEEGISTGGRSARGKYPSQSDYSYETIKTNKRCHYARSHLHLLRGAIDLGAANIMVGQQAHQTLEHALKALISASGRRYAHHHNLVSLEGDARRFDSGFTHPLESDLDALNDYSGRLKYNEPHAPLGDREELYRRVLGDTQKIFERVALLSGLNPWEEQQGKDG